MGRRSKAQGFGAAETLDAAQLRPSVHPTYARLLVAELKRRGFSDADIFAESRTSWEQLLAEDRLLSLERFRIIALRGMQLSGEEWLGLPAGRSTQPSSHGPLGYAIVASPNVGVALRLIEKHSEIRLRVASFSVTEEGERIRLVVSDTAGWTDLREYISLHIAGAIAMMLEAITGGPLPDTTFAFPFPRPAWSARCAEHLRGVRTDFDAPSLVLDFPVSFASAPCITADSSALEQAVRLCEREEARRRSESDVAGRVLNHLLGCQDQYPTLHEMAKTLHMSERTLIRRLKAQDTSYQALLDDVRQELALWYLRQTDLTIEAIADRLGYRDTSNFSRTFRRWFGVTPRSARGRDAGD